METSRTRALPNRAAASAPLLTTARKPLLMEPKYPPKRRDWEAFTCEFFS